MKRFKILLVSVYSDKMILSYDDIGLASIAAYLRKFGYEVHLIVHFFNKMDYKRIVDLEPDFVGISVYRDSKDEVIQFCEYIKTLLPEVKTCLGGAFATYYHKELLNESMAIDYIIRGEGELALRNLLSTLEAGGDLPGIKGLTYRSDGRIHENEKESLIADMNELPFPSRDMLLDHQMNVAIISSTRGCFGKCTFCESPDYWSEHGDQRWRGRSVEGLVDEIEEIAQRYGVRRFNIVNNSFEDPGSDAKSVKKFAEEILKRNLTISYSINLRTIFQRKCTPELVRLLKKSGLCSVFLGVEAANAFDLQFYGKYGTTEDNMKCVELFREQGIRVIIGFINFNPYSTLKGLRSNLAFLQKYEYTGFLSFLHRLRIEKGTKLFHKLNEDKLWKDEKKIYLDGLNYKHTDERIDSLVAFLHNRFVEDRETEAINYRILYFERFFYTYLAYNKHLFEAEQDETGLSYVLECEKRLDESFSQFSCICSEWFSGLLDLAESGWDDREAELWSELKLNKQCMEKYDTQFGLERSKLYKKLMRLGNKYEEYVI
ncbi:radical SAM protein [Paenibacillus sp. M1]|uniref:Radical SAM protein n=1 Tax=Paenibacillus haidiansis TaxID=1574488 RepID=A0ABU7VQA5_9BACL